MDQAKRCCKWLFTVPTEDDKEKRMTEDDPSVMGFYHGDPTPVEFLRKYLVAPLEHMSIYDARTFQLRNSLMLFGKKGAGKKTLVDAFVGQFSHTIGFAMEDFNVAEFVEWVDSTVSKLEKNVSTRALSKRSLKPTLVVVEGIDIVPHCQSPIPEHKLRKLLYHVRALGQRGHPIFIICTCNESPGRLAREISLMIDYECYVPPPSEEDRGKLFEFFIESWSRVIETKADLRRITVDLTPEDYELLVSLSGNCAPGDIWKFCQDMFHAVCRPGEEVSLDGNLIQTLIKHTESGPCILHYDPKEDLDQFDVYIGKRKPNLEAKQAPSAQEALDKRAERMEDQEQQWPPPRNNQEHVPWIQEARAEQEAREEEDDAEEEDESVAGKPRKRPEDDVDGGSSSESKKRKLE